MSVDIPLKTRQAVNKDLNRNREKLVVMFVLLFFLNGLTVQANTSNDLWDRAVCIR
jgi:hypothetical protein